MPISLEYLLKDATGADILLPTVAPYVWSGGKHDIPMTRAYIPIIGMAYVHHGATPPNVSDSDFSELEEGASAEGASDEAVKKFEEAVIDRAVFSSMPQLRNWYMILVACQQVKELKASNLENFSRMCRCQALPQKAGAFIAYWAATQEDFASNTSVREKFDGNKFFEYHTTGSSTPMLCKDAISEAAGLEVFSASEVGMINSAVGAYYDLEAARTIDVLTIVKSSAVLEAAGRLPDNWWMGKKAVERYSSKRYSALVKHLKRIFDIQMNTDGIEGMDLPTLVASLNRLLSTSSVLTPPTGGAAGSLLRST